MECIFPATFRVCSRATLLVLLLSVGGLREASASPQVSRNLNGRVDRQLSPTPTSALRYAFKPLHDLQENPEKRFPRLAGEFEPQKAILLSVSDLMYQHNGVLTQIVEKASGRVPVVIMFNDEKQLESTVKLLDTLDCNLDHISLYNLKLDTIWLRDFGPRIVETEKGAMSMDFFYDGQRPLDDKFPISWGELTNAQLKRVKWTLHGGNLISNGKGLAIASSRLFEDNRIAFPHPTPRMDVEFERRKIVTDAFKEECNINQLLILEPLRPEATQHVDMFATFLAEDQVLLAQLDPRLDPVNASVLDYNAKLLSQVKVDGKPMRVERIRIPPRQDKYWSPYTNIILAKNLVLMPVYKSDPPQMVRDAVNVYRKLLPGVHVETVDMTSMQKLEGALHCMSINVPEFAELPTDRMTFAEAKSRLQRSGYVSLKKTPEKSPEIKTEIDTDEVVESSSKQTPPENRQAIGSSERSASERESSRLSAVATYRRNFVDQSRQFAVEAYAVGVENGSVLLVRADSKKEIQVAIQYLCQEDKMWLSKNIQKIRDNGPKVREFVLADSL